MSNILVLTDFGAVARHAIDYACHLCNNIKADHLYLLNTFETIPIYDASEAGLLALSSYEVDAIEESRQKNIAQLVEEIKPQLTITTIVPLIANDFLTNAVNEICNEKKIDLTIIGVKGKEVLEEAFFGSQTYKAIEFIDNPVLIVPQNAPIQAPEEVLLAVDFENLSSAGILKKLKHYLEKFNTKKVTAVHNVSNSRDLEYIQKHANNLAGHFKDLQCQVTLLDDGSDVAASINNHAAKNKTSLIITIHKTRGFFSSLFHRSITKKIAWHSTLPVLVFHLK